MCNHTYSGYLIYSQFRYFLDIYFSLMEESLVPVHSDWCDKTITLFLENDAHLSIFLVSNIFKAQNC